MSTAQPLDCIAGKRRCRNHCKQTFPVGIHTLCRCRCVVLAKQSLFRVVLLDDTVPSKCNRARLNAGSRSNFTFLLWLTSICDCFFFERISSIHCCCWKSLNWFWCCCYFFILLQIKSKHYNYLYNFKKITSTQDENRNISRLAYHTQD